MFCVIQKVTLKKNNPYGEHKELLAYTGFSVDGKPKYAYSYSKERFERPIRDAYKIMIHHSYREKGQVRKRQWSICTMNYYNLLDSWPGDCINTSILKDKLLDMGIGDSDLWKMVYEKLDPIVAKVKKEFERTPEFKAEKKHKSILRKYRVEKNLFESRYGADTYDLCYDIFGVLRNEGYLLTLQKQYNEKQESYKRSYQSNSQSNYSSGSKSSDDFFKNFAGSFSSYFANQGSTYTEPEKLLLKGFFRTLTKSYHPDITKDDGQAMKLISKLKQGWGI